MRSSIYINQISPEHVTWDSSLSPQEIMSEKNGVGFSFLKTAEHLGMKIEKEDINGYRWPIYNIYGSVEGIKRNNADLQRHIGLIARYGAESGRVNRDWLGRILGKLVQETIPAFDEETSLANAVAEVSYPFADLTNDDGVAIGINKFPHYGLSSEGRNSDRDVPGTVII